MTKTELKQNLTGLIVGGLIICTPWNLLVMAGQAAIIGVAVTAIAMAIAAGGALMVGGLSAKPPKPYVPQTWVQKVEEEIEFDGQGLA